MIATAPVMARPAYPALNDLAGWRSYVATMDSAILAIVQGMTLGPPAEVEERLTGEARVYVVTPASSGTDARFVYLDIHGGALILGAGVLCKAFGRYCAARLDAKVWAVDYRMPPTHPFPAALDDCLAAYRALLDEYAPENVIVGGTSAGGNLAAAMLLRARDEKLPMPAAVVLDTPEVDLTESGDSFQTNLGLDFRLTGSLMPINLLYANGHDLAHPDLSPLFGDYSKGFPPTLLIAGTRDLLLSNAVRMHWALLNSGIPAELLLTEAGSHGGFPGTPEGDQLLAQTRRFLRGHWGRRSVGAEGP